MPTRPRLFAAVILVSGLSLAFAGCAQVVSALNAGVSYVESHPSQDLAALIDITPAALSIANGDFNAGSVIPLAINSAADYDPAARVPLTTVAADVQTAVSDFSGDRSIGATISDAIIAAPAIGNAADIVLSGSAANKFLSNLGIQASAAVSAAKP